MLNDVHCLPATMYDNSNQVIKFFMINCIIRLEKTSNQNKFIKKKKTPCTWLMPKTEKETLINELKYISCKKQQLQ